MSQPAMTLLIATSNRGKVREFREMLGQDRFAWGDLSAYPDTPPVEETGHTFRANACLKAAGYAKRFNTYALADDSGLTVDALSGRPGVYSARWAEMYSAGAGDSNNNRLLLSQLADVPESERTARFFCVLALSDPKGRILLTTQDSVEGSILRSPRGSNGFGYDPLFFVNEVRQTAAEISPEDKHRLSHRGKALRQLRQLMDDLDFVAGRQINH